MNPDEIAYAREVSGLKSNTSLSPVKRPRFEAALVVRFSGTSCMSGDDFHVASYVKEQVTQALRYCDPVEVIALRVDCVDGEPELTLDELKTENRRLRAVLRETGEILGRYGE